MRRSWAAVAGIVLLLVAAGAGFFVSVRIGPERVRTELEERLAELLGPVEVGPVRPSFAWGIALEIDGIRTPPGSDGEVLSAERARVTFDLRKLLRGELRIRRVAISGLHLDAVRTAQGAWRPEALVRLWEGIAGGPPGPEHAGAGGYDAARRAAEASPALTIDRSSLRIRSLDAEGNAASELGLHDIWLRLDRPLLGGAVHVSGAGRVEGQRGSLELAGDLPASGSPHAELALADVDLAALAPWLGRSLGLRDQALEVAGRASATLRWSPGSPGIQQLGLELLLFDGSLAARLGGQRPPLRAALTSAHASAAMEVGPHELRVRSLEWTSGSLHVAGSARSGRPVGGESPLDVELRAGPVAWPSLRDALRAAASPDVRRILDAVTDGAIPSITARASGATWSDWRALFANPLDGWPPGLALDADLTGFDIDLGATRPIRDLATHASWTQDRVELRDARAKLGDRPLPGLHLAVDGVRAVIAALRAGHVPDPVPPVPGFVALNDWIELQKKPGAPSKWKRLELDLDWLDHPALLRPLERVRAVLTPAEPGFHFELAEGFWGGAHVSGRGTIVEGSPGSIDVEVTAALPLRPAMKPADAEPWLRGSWRAALEKLGPFLADHATGRLQATGDHVWLLDVDAAMRPSGWVKGETDLDMSRAESVPYRLTVEAEGLSMSQTMGDLDLDPEDATGTLKIGGSLTGHLVPGAHGTRNLADASGPVSGHVRHGEIRRRLNLMMAIAAASDTLNPFRSRDVIEFDKIDADMQMENGIAHVASMSLTGPATRMVGTGTIDVATEPHDIEGVVALYFFKTLDRVISVVPIVNKLLLGDDANLVAAYFAVSGPWGDPKASVIPIKTLLAVPTNIVIEGVPAFVRSGISQIEHLLSMLPGTEKSEKPEPPAPPHPPQSGASGAAAADAAAAPGVIP